jgi:hypothetical protein
MLEVCMAVSGLSSRSFASYGIDYRIDALEHRRRALSAALALYEEAPIGAAPRLALIRRTRLAIADVEDALARHGSQRD